MTIDTKPTYTERIHAERLLEMLEQCKGPVEHCCPAAEDFEYDNDVDELWSNEIDPCRICLRFVGLHDMHNCPCFVLDDPVAVTYEKLVEKGYLLKE